MELGKILVYTHTFQSQSESLNSYWRLNELSHDPLISEDAQYHRSNFAYICDYIGCFTESLFSTVYRGDKLYSSQYSETAVLNSTHMYPFIQLSRLF